MYSDAQHAGQFLFLFDKSKKTISKKRKYMSQLYWDTSFLSPLFTMDHKQLKRSRSSDSINDNKNFKRSKPLQLIESPA